MLGLGAEDARIKVTLESQDQTDIAAQGQRVLEELLQIMKIEAHVDLSQPPVAGPDPTPLALSVRGDDLGMLIGRRGQTLSSLQYIVNLVVARQFQSRVPIVLDVEGYRERRYKTLQALAKRLAERALALGHPVAMEPMPANERRIVHLALKDYPNVITQSQGEGESRQVIITPRKR